MQKCPSLPEFFNLNQGLSLCHSKSFQELTQLLTQQQSLGSLQQFTARFEWSKKCLLVNPGCRELHPHVNWVQQWGCAGARTSKNLCSCRELISPGCLGCCKKAPGQGRVPWDDSHLGHAPQALGSAQFYIPKWANTSGDSQCWHVSVLTSKNLFSGKCFQIQLDIERCVKEFTSSHAKVSTWNKLGGSSARRKD